MKLTASGASPYVRKAMVCAILRGLDAQIEKWVITTTDPVLAQSNPLSKVPTLLTDDGLAFFDSPVICEYLDSLGSAAPLFPAMGPAPIALDFAVPVVYAPYDSKQLFSFFVGFAR